MKKYISKEGEDLGSIAGKLGMPSWKYLYELNKETIGDNPDLLKPGTELTIPQWDSTCGDEKLKAKGVEDPEKWSGWAGWRYPWVKYSGTMSTDKGAIYKEKSNSGEDRSDFASKKRYEFRNGDNEFLLASGEIGDAEELELLIPDAKHLHVFIDGIKYERCERWNGEA
jgi:hypothetical protein